MILETITCDSLNDETTKTPTPHDPETPKPDDGDGTVNPGKKDEDEEIKPYK